ncbi:hypothetical protein LAZ67_3002466 [Cordylochernes scorpioides]|uniref:Uncharacterized protein n=1 Tax=Cordylochernes scorpioides TaxID=51811 RepID=A0ABY6K7U1_9ARAC|nr:hypothetical protein LAZ67_3002466 [Cordylochernes scorpioides]
MLVSLEARNVVYRTLGGSVSRVVGTDPQGPVRSSSRVRGGNPWIGVSSRALPLALSLPCGLVRHSCCFVIPGTSPAPLRTTARNLIRQIWLRWWVRPALVFSSSLSGFDAWVREFVEVPKNHHSEFNWNEWSFHTGAFHLVPPKEKITKNLRKLPAGAAFIASSAPTTTRELSEEDPLHRPDISPSEIANAIEHLPRGKAPGWDGLPCEFLVALSEDFFTEALARVFAASRLRGTLPPSTRRSSICLVPKARGGRGLDGYRPVALPSADYRVLAAILHRRLKPHLRTLVPECQTYAVPGRSPSWNIAIVTDAVEEATALGSPLAVMGVDLESAFDSLDRGFLESLITSLRLPPAFRAWINILYAGADATIRRWEGSDWGHRDAKRTARQGKPSVEKNTLSGSTQIIHALSVLTAFPSSPLYTIRPMRRPAGAAFIASSAPTTTRELSKEDPLHRPDISSSEIAAIEHLPRGKAPGWDGLPCELLVALSEDFFTEALARVFAASRLRGTLPPSTRRSSICLVPKARGGRGLDGYRPVALPSADYRVLAAILHRRLKPHLRTLVPECQTYAVPGRSPSWNIAMVTDAVEEATALGSPLAVMGVDLESAFDSIDRGFLESLLTSLRLPPAFRAWINILYAGADATIRAGGFYTTAFPLLNGLRQGCAVSAALFSIATGPLLRRLELTLGVGNVIAYADDIVLLFHRDEDFERVATVFEDYEQASGVGVNLRKSAGLWCGAWRNRGDSPLGASWSTTSIRILGLDIAPRSTVAHRDNVSWPSWRLRAADGRPSPAASPSSDEQERRTRWWGQDPAPPAWIPPITPDHRPTGEVHHTAWLPSNVMARPVTIGGLGLLDLASLLQLACLKGVQVALGGGRNAFSWLVGGNSGVAWIHPPPDGTRLQPRRLRLLKLWEEASNILGLNHRALPTAQLLDLPIIGGCRFLRPPDLLAPARWRGARVRDLIMEKHLIARPTRSALADAAALGAFYRRLTSENAVGFGAESAPSSSSLAAAVVLRGTATPFLNGLTTRSARRALDRPRLAATPISRFTSRWSLTIGPPPSSWPSTPCPIRPTHPASVGPSCPACGSIDRSLSHRYWCCPSIRPLIREAFNIIGRPPDLQAWIFGGSGLEDDDLSILASAKLRIYRYFVQVGLGEAVEDPLIAWSGIEIRAATLSRAPPFSLLECVSLALTLPNSVSKDSPRSADQVPERPSTGSQPGEEFSPKNENMMKNSKEISFETQKDANSPAGNMHVNLAAVCDDVTAPLTAATTSATTANPTPLNWADSEKAEVDANDGYTVVKGKKRRRGSTSPEHAARQPNKPGEQRSPQQRKRPTGPRAVPPQEIKATRANIADARARQASTNHENYVFVELCPDIPDYSHLKAMSTLLGWPKSITQFNRMNGHYIVGLANRNLANRLVADGLEIEGTNLKVFSFRKRAERIVVANLPGFVEDSTIVTALGQFGRVTSIAPILVKMGEFTFTDGRREAFILLREGVRLETLPTRLTIQSKGDTLSAFLSFGIKCSKCGKQGHRRANCPALARQGNGSPREAGTGARNTGVPCPTGEDINRGSGDPLGAPSCRTEGSCPARPCCPPCSYGCPAAPRTRDPSARHRDVGGGADLNSLHAFQGKTRNRPAAGAPREASLHCHRPLRAARPRLGGRTEAPRLSNQHEVASALAAGSTVLDRVSIYATSHYHLSDHRLVLLQVGPPTTAVSSPTQPRLAAMLRSGLALEHLAGYIREMEEDTAHDDDDGTFWDRWTSIKAGLLAEARSLHDPRHAASDSYVYRARRYIAAQLDASSIRADYPSLPDLARAIHLRRPVSVIRDNDDNVIEGPELRRKAYAIFQPFFARPSSDPAAGAAFIGNSMITPISELGEEDPLHGPKSAPARLPPPSATSFAERPPAETACHANSSPPSRTSSPKLWPECSRRHGSAEPCLRRRGAAPSAWCPRPATAHRTALGRLQGAGCHSPPAPQAHLRALVPDCQTYAIPGRSPSWNIAKETDAVEEATAMGSPLAVMGVDLESVFDSLDRGFLESLLTSLRLLPPACLQGLDQYPLRRGGCHDPGRRLSHHRLTPPQRPTTGLRPDDIVLLYHRDEDFERVATVLENFKRASGIAVNLGKGAGLWCGAWRNRGDSPLGASWSTTSIRVLELDIAPRSSVAHQEQHLLALLESACRRWTPFTRGLSLVGRARAANSLVGSTIQHHLHGYLPSPPTIAKLQARLARFVWGPEHTAWLPAAVMARPVAIGGLGLLDLATQLQLACLKGVQVALRGGRNGFDWLVASGSEAWIRPPPDGMRLQPRRLRLLKLWEEASKILSLNHRAVPTSQLLDIPIIGGCRFLPPPDLLAPARWRGARVRDLLAEDHLIVRPTRSVLADAAALGAFCRRLTSENAVGFGGGGGESPFSSSSLGAAVVLRGTATPFLNGLTTRSARRALDSSRLAATPISRFIARWTPTIAPPSMIDWASLRRCAFSGHEADAALKLALHALPHPAHPASAGPSCPACESVDRSLGHRYWRCRSIRPLIREAFNIIGRPPDLQAWIFGGPGLEDDALSILTSAKLRVYRHFVQVGLGGVSRQARRPSRVQPPGPVPRPCWSPGSRVHLRDQPLLPLGPPPRLAAMLRSGLALEHLAGYIRELEEDTAHDDDDGILWDRWTTIKAGLQAEARSLHDPRYAASDSYIYRARRYIAAKLEASSIRADYPSLPDLAHAIRLRRPVSVIRDEQDNIIEGPELRRRAYATFQPRFARPTSDPAAEAAFIASSQLTTTRELREEDPLHRPDFSPSEIANAIEHLPRGKAPGWDGLPCELLVAFNEDFFAEALARVFAASRLRGTLPPSTRRSSICLVPKARGGRGLDGYRPFALPSADYRVLAAFLHRRLKPHLRTLVPECQTYAVPGRSPSWNIAMVTDAVEEATALGSPLAVMGVDLESAFDSLDRGFLESLLTSLRLPPAFRTWINILFYTTAFPLLNGLRQGCAVSAALFSIATGPLLRRLELTLGVGNVIAYADDIVLLFHSDGVFERVATVFEEYRQASRVGVNLRKSAGLWCGAWRNRDDSPLGPSWSTTSIRVLVLDIAPRSTVAHREQHLMALLETACRRWMPFTRGLSLVGRARAAKTLVGSVIQHQLHGYLPSPPTIAKLQARLARFIWGQDHTAWLPAVVMARPVAIGGLGLLDLATQLQLACLKGVQVALRGGRNAFSWLVGGNSGEAWIHPPPDGNRLQPRRLRLLKLWEVASNILGLNHRAVPTAQLLDLPIIGGFRFLRPPDLLAPARWSGARVRDLIEEEHLVARPTRSALADAAALGAFCRRLTTENAVGFGAESTPSSSSLAAAVVLRGTATPFHNGLTTRPARRALDRPRLAHLKVYLEMLAHHRSTTIQVRLGLAAALRLLGPRGRRRPQVGPPRPAPSGPSCLGRPLLSCLRVHRPRPPDLQAWIFGGSGLEDDALSILASANGQDLCLGYNAVVLAHPVAISGSGLACVFGPGVAVIQQRILWPGHIAFKP